MGERERNGVGEKKIREICFYKLASPVYWGSSVVNLKLKMYFSMVFNGGRIRKIY